VRPAGGADKGRNVSLRLPSGTASAPRCYSVRRGCRGHQRRPYRRVRVRGRMLRATCPDADSPKLHQGPAGPPGAPRRLSARRTRTRRGRARSADPKPLYGARSAVRQTTRRGRREIRSCSVSPASLPAGSPAAWAGGGGLPRGLSTVSTRGQPDAQGGQGSRRSDGDAEDGKAGAQLRTDHGSPAAFPASSVWPHHHPPQTLPPRGRGEG